MFDVDMWNYKHTEDQGAEVAGFEVEAVDGSIGKVDAATYETDRSAIVVDTGPWIFGKKVMLPAGVIDRIDYSEEKVYVNRTKDQIKNAPEYDEVLADDESYRGGLATYYGPDGSGYRSHEDLRLQSDPSRRNVVA